MGYPGEYGIGIFARIRAQKGIGILVDAMIPIMKENPAPTVLIAGETTQSHEGFVKKLKEKIKLDSSLLKDRSKVHILPMPKLYPGKYRIEWRALSPDGHIIKGKSNFEVK